MIIPGDNRSEASKQDAYMEILVDELLFLTKSVTIYDYLGAPVNLKIKLLMYILDYPGFCKLFHLSGSGALKGCIWCEMTGIYCKHLSKTVYLRNRSYLQEGFTIPGTFPISAESKQQPRIRLKAECDAYAQAYENVKNKAQASSLATATGIKGVYPLMKLPDHNRIEESVPDGMHTIQRCLLNIHNLITGKDDSLNVRLQEKVFGRFPNIWPTSPSDSISCSEGVSSTQTIEIDHIEDESMQTASTSATKFERKRKRKPKVFSSHSKKG